MPPANLSALRRLPQAFNRQVAIYQCRQCFQGESGDVYLLTKLADWILFGQELERPAHAIYFEHSTLSLQLLRPSAFPIFYGSLRGR